MGSSSDRLPSFKGPRDLSLASRAGGGGSKSSGTAGAQQTSQPRPKRVFTPNIPPKRDRVSGAGSVSSTGSPQQSTAPSGRGKSPRGRGRGGGRGAGKQRGELVQADSIFSDGVGDPTEARKQASQQYRSSYGGTRYKSATEGGSSRISSVNRSTLNTLIKEEDEESNKKIFGDQIEPTEEEETSLDNPNVPVVLPLSSYVPEYFTEPSTLEHAVAKLAEPIASTSSSEPTLVPVVSIKQEKMDEVEAPIVSIKQETPDDDDTTSQNERLLRMMSLEPTAFANVFRRTPKDGTLVYFQFPDELPVLEGSVREPTDASQCSNANKATAQLVRDIDDLPEGFVGRLQIMSSGRTRFVIGENSFDVDPGRPVGFRQDLYAADMENKTLTNLGPVKNKFVLTPDIEYLLRDPV